MAENGNGGVGVFALGLLVGAAAGVAIGMLYAPMNGADARRRVADSTRDLSGRARDLGNTARDLGNTVRDQAERVVRHVRREGAETVDDIERA
jgi:gas vesicle protein